MERHEHIMDLEDFRQDIINEVAAGNFSLGESPAAVFAQMTFIRSPL